MVSGVNAIEVATCNNPPIINYCYNCTQTRSSATCKIMNNTVTCPGYFGRDTSRQCKECRYNCTKNEW